MATPVEPCQEQVLAPEPTCPRPDVRGAIVLGVMVGLGTLFLLSLAPFLAGAIGVLGAFCVWRVARTPRQPTAAATGPRLSRLAFGSTLLGTVSLGITFSSGVMLPSAGLVAVALALVALRLIRRRPDRTWGKVFACTGIVLGLVQVFLFAFLFKEARRAGFQSVG